jgi:hypothetical protein
MGKQNETADSIIFYQRLSAFISVYQRNLREHFHQDVFFLADNSESLRRL